MQFRKSRPRGEVLKLQSSCLKLQERLEYDKPTSDSWPVPLKSGLLKIPGGRAMAHDDAALRAEMTALVAELAPNEGMTPSLLDGVAFGRSNRSLPRTPVM